jgi:hydrogenase maturation protease
MTAPILIFAYGNPARGDDALGPLLADWAEDWAAGQGLEREIQVLTDFQLSPEHAYDLIARRHVIFIDAAREQTPSCVWHTLTARQPASWTTHASSPAAVLWFCQELLQQTPPDAKMLSLAGTAFELATGLSTTGEQSLAAGKSALERYLHSVLERVPN